ncbi:MAG: HEAT repeat domain-containing protein [Pirellulaceae bacterium]
MMRTLKCLTFMTCLLWGAVSGHAQEEVARLAAQLESPDLQVRIAACQELAKLGARAQEAVPSLITALQADDAELQRNAALALGQIGEAAAAAVPALAENLTDQDPKVRAYSAHALGAIGPPARSATEALIAAFTDEDPTVRRVVRDALRSVDPPRELALPLLIKMLNTAQPADAAAAVLTLAEAGEAAVPGLISALDDPDAAYWACLGLSEIGPQAAPAVPKLGSLLESEEPEVRMQALVALAAIGPASQAVTEKIIARLSDDDVPGVRYAAAYALGSIGDKAQGMPALAQAMGQEDEFLRIAAAWAYVRLVEGESTPLLDKAAKIVIDSLASNNHHVRDLATRALADPDIPAAAVRPAFRKVLRGIRDPAKLMEIVDALASLGPRVVPLCIQSLEERGPLRFYALQLLIKVGPEAAPAVPALVTTLHDPEPQLRREALFALGAIGAASATATDTIATLLTDKDEEVRHAACYALGKIGPEARAALPKLRAAMETEDEFLRLAAVWASLKITPEDEELQRQAVPLLTKGLVDSREHLRIESAYTLGELGAVAKPALPALKEAQQDDSADVRAAATKALEQIGN